MRALEAREAELRTVEVRLLLLLLGRGGGGRSAGYGAVLLQLELLDTQLHMLPPHTPIPAYRCTTATRYRCRSSQRRFTSASFWLRTKSAACSTSRAK